MKKWMYVISVSAMLAVFLFFYLTHMKEAAALEQVRKEKVAQQLEAEAKHKAEIEAKARETGHCDAYAVYQALGAAPRCGCCLEMAQDIVDDVHGAPHTLRKAAE